MAGSVSQTVVLVAGGIITLALTIAGLLEYASTQAAGTAGAAVTGTATSLQAALPFIAVLFTFGALYAVIRGRR